jgi:hypothetical protein
MQYLEIMKLEKIIEGNRLIAKFMGYNVEMIDNEFYFTLDDMLESFCNDEIHYHSSWDWLMPVMQKIGTLGFCITLEFDEKPYLTYISIMDNSTATYIDEDYEDRDYEIESDIHLAWFNVVNFIKWYNKQEDE